MMFAELGRMLEAIGKEMQEVTPVNTTDALRYVDPDTIGLGAAARRAIRAGELRASRVGRKLLVDVDEMRRWIGMHRVERPKPRAVEDEGDEVDKVIEMNNRRRRGKV